MKNADPISVRFEAGHSAPHDGVSTSVSRPIRPSSPLARSDHATHSAPRRLPDARDLLSKSAPRNNSRITDALRPGRPVNFRIICESFRGICELQALQVYSRAIRWSDAA